MSEKRKIDVIDMSIGDRIRMRRIMRKMTQVELSAGIGVTFQQLQKYEKGSNRIGASRLYRIAQILQTPVEFFFEDLPGPKGRDEPLPAYLVALMRTTPGPRLVEGLGRISDRQILYDLVELIESIADTGGKPLRPTRVNRRKPSRAVGGSS
jgi:transcriptional regulator with XRE-family HTH domain